MRLCANKQVFACAPDIGNSCIRKFTLQKQACMHDCKQSKERIQSFARKNKKQSLIQKIRLEAWDSSRPNKFVTSRKPNTEP